MPTGDFNRNLPLLLLQAREAVLGHFRPIIAHMGLSEQQWRIVRALHERGSLEPREISDLCQILGPSLAGVLARMEKTGLVTRKRMTHDQRRVVVQLTKKSEELVESILPTIRRQYELLELAYGRELVAEIYAVVDRLLAVSDRVVAKAELPDIKQSKRKKVRPADPRHRVLAKKSASH